MKIKNTILATLCIMGLGGALALTPILNKKQNNNDVNNVIRQENKKYANSNYNEPLNALDTEFINFKTYLRSIESDIDSLFGDSYLYEVNISSTELNVGDYNNFPFMEYDGESLYWEATIDNINYQIQLDTLEEESNYFRLWDMTNSLLLEPTELTFGLSVSDGIATAVFNALDLDIEANTATMGSSITGAITSGLGLVGSLATEFITGFSALLWNSTSNTLTSFGTFALVFLGIAITMAVIKLVLAILRGNTGA